MRVEQMLYHVNEALEMALGLKAVGLKRIPIPRSVAKFLVLNMPWPKGAPTAPELLPRDQHDFATEQSRCIALLDRVGSRDLQETWPVHPAFGAMSGPHWSALGAKHVSHHLRQFGA